MKIISWNLANRVRKQQLQLDALVSREADLIGLQKGKYRGSGSIEGQVLQYNKSYIIFAA